MNCMVRYLGGVCLALFSPLVPFGTVIFFSLSVGGPKVSLLIFGGVLDAFQGPRKRFLDLEKAYIMMEYSL